MSSGAGSGWFRHVDSLTYKNRAARLFHAVCRENPGLHTDSGAHMGSH